MLVPFSVVLLLTGQLVVSQANESTTSDNESAGLTSLHVLSTAGICDNEDYGALSACVPCSHLPLDFIDCEDLIDHQGNATALAKSDNLGCLRFGGTSSKGRGYPFLLIVFLAQ